MLALLRHPDQLPLLRESPNKLRSSRSGLAQIALEEILRWSSPVNYFARTATTDTMINGVDIKTDDRVVMWYVSANRDPDAFADPDTFNVNRHTRELATTPSAEAARTIVKVHSWPSRPSRSR
jgi:cholest-4-en-3-one 26-monooxygenase